MEDLKIGHLKGLLNEYLGAKHRPSYTQDIGADATGLSPRQDINPPQRP